MTITATELENKYTIWVRGKRNILYAKHEILHRFPSELENGPEWTEQDICEQSRKIICYWDNQQNSKND